IGKGMVMSRDGEYDEEYDDATVYDDSDLTHEIEGGDHSGGIDPLDINDPKSAYFFLSDDAQDEIAGGEKKRMKCNECGHRFRGTEFDDCPECFSADTEVLISGIGDEEKDHDYHEENS
ncbi:MAG: hypothetical protein ABII26_01000, partial [Pseudomonadota bacterium]